MVKMEATRPAQARLWIKANFLSVQLVSWSTSGCTTCCSAAGWAHMQRRKPLLCLQPQMGSTCGSCVVEMHYGPLQTAAKVLPKTLTWSALPGWLGCTDWPSNLVASHEDWFHDSQTKFLRTVLIVCLWNTLLWQWWVKSWEIGISFLLDLLDSRIVWQAHHHKGCSVSAPLYIYEL